MSGDVKIVAFRGIPKREEILLRSFLNLADSDFECRVEAEDSDGTVDVVVIDESVLQDISHDPGEGSSFIVLGTGGPYPGMCYVSRPLHWSSFNQVFEETIAGKAAGSGSEFDEITEDQIMILQSVEPEQDVRTEPTEGRKSGTEQSENIELLENPASEEIPEDISSLEVVPFEPGESAMPPHALSGSDNSGAAGATGGDDEGAGTGAETDADVIALKLSDSDEEVWNGPVGIELPDEDVTIETDFIEAWTISIEAELDTVSQTLNNIRRTPLAREPVGKKQPKSGKGVRLPAGIRFWESDAEILLGDTPLFLIDERGQRLYSDSPIREWTKILREKNLIRRDLAEGWFVDPSVKSSPLPWFLWCSAQARSKGRLHPKVDPDQQYLLEKWPHFELIRNDNESLKLCALLFSSPESIKSLVAKSDIKGRKVVAFMNACYLLGLVKMTGIDEEVAWRQHEQARPLSWLQRLRRSWGPGGSP